MNTYKLSFTNKESWDTIKSQLFTEKELSTITSTTYQINGILVREIGNIPIQEELDEEGNIIIEAGFHDDYAVDIYSPIELDIVNEYEIEEKDNYYHSFAL